MPTACAHGYPPSECLICRTLGVGEHAAEVVEAPPARRRPVGPHDVPVQPAVIGGSPSPPVPHRRSVAGTVVLALISLLAIGAAAWILTGIVFTVLHLLELIVVAAGAGWVGYKIGEFRGSRRPRSR